MVFWLSKRQLYDELSVARAGFHADASVMPVHDDPVHDFEPESGTLAGRFGGEERLEEVFANVRRNAGAVVFHNNHRVIALPACGNRENARIVHRVERVRNQIGPGLVQLAGVGANLVQRAIVIAPDFDSRAFLHPVSEQPQRGIEPDMNIDGLELRLVHIGVLLHGEHEV